MTAYHAPPAFHQTTAPLAGWTIGRFDMPLLPLPKALVSDPQTWCAAALVNIELGHLGQAADHPWAPNWTLTVVGLEGTYRCYDGAPPDFTPTPTSKEK